MQSLYSLGQRIADRVRFEAYAEALRRAITPETIVLELGAGTGALSLLACKLGAQRVYAIEASANAQIIRDSARDNRLEGRIVVIEEHSSNVTLPERAHVLVADLRGVLPPFKQSLRDIADARRRHLVEGGLLIAQRDELFVAIVDAAVPFQASRTAWTSEPYGLRLTSALRYVENTWHGHRASVGDLRSGAVRWATIDYSNIADGHVRGRASCTIEATGSAHGLLVWFDSVLAEGVTVPNRPGAAPTGYGQAFFPWPRAVDLRKGDVVDVELRADPIGADYVWSWNTELGAAAGDLPSTLKQSSFLARPLSKKTLSQYASSAAPARSAVGESALFVLQRMGAGATLGDLASELHRACPEQFNTVANALDFVASVSATYGR